MRKTIVGVMALLVVLTTCAPEAEAGRRHRGGGSFWGGFAAGAITGAVTGALLGPPVVVAPPPPVVMGPPRYVRPRRVWVPGAYVVRHRPCGTPYRAWRRGYYRRY